jgi:hypothetical protein
MASVAEALPGSRSAALATALGELWELRLAAWAEAGSGYANGLHLVGRDYDAEDSAAAGQLDTTGPGWCERPAAWGTAGSGEEGS